MKILRYLSGTGRNPDDPKTAHMYAEIKDEDGDVYYMPMCRKGWNRSHGAGISIHRGVLSGVSCKTCLKRHADGKEPVEAKYGSHKTKYL